jgi:large repetitive protein
MSVQISIKLVDGNNYINATNAASGITITGSSSDSIPADLVGQTVNVTLNGKTYTGAVQSDGSWSVSVGASDLAALVNGHAYSVAASVTDSVGIKASASDTVTDDKTATLTIKPIDGNGFINGKNATAGITITGTSTGGVGTGDFAGEIVTVTLNGKTYTATIASNGNWSVSVGAADLAALSNGQTYSVTASATDKSGNAVTTTSSVAVDEKAGVSINPIDSNNFINATNAANGITITGSTSDSIPADLDGQTVKVTLNGKTYSGTIQSNGTWSVSVGAADLSALLNGHAYTATASVTDLAGNTATASDSVTVDATAALAIKPIDGNNFINAKNATAGITITGTSTGGVGTSDFAGETVLVTLNGKTYTATIASGGTWSVSVGAADLAALSDGQTYTVTATATDKAGNPVTTTSSVVADKAASVSINPIDGNNLINATNVATGISITGKTSDSIPADLDGQTVKVTLNGKTYMGVIQSDGTWSVRVGATDLAALVNGHTYSAVASVTDLAGNTATKSDSVKVDTNVVISISPIDGNSFINGTNAANGITIAGTATDTVPTNLNGRTISVVLNNKTYTGTIQNGAWSVNIGASELGSLADGQAYTVTASATDKAGNSDSISTAVSVDKTESISINPVDGNGFINGSNAANGITITGKSSDSVPANLDGQNVTVSLNGQAYTGTIQNDGSWSVNVGSAAIAGLADGQTYTVTASATDLAGNTASRSLGVTTDETATLSINPIDGNGFINGSDAANGITITGKSSDSVPANLDGQTVTVALNGQTYTGTIQNDGTWSVAIGPGALVALGNGQNYTVTARVNDVAGNSATATNNVTVDETLPTVTITPTSVVEATDATNGFELFGTTTGFTNGQVVTVQLVNSSNGVVGTYTGTVTHNDWSVQVPASVEATLSDGTYTVTANLTDQFGNPATEATQSLTVSSVSGAGAIVTLSVGSSTLTQSTDGTTVVGTASTLNSGDQLIGGGHDVLALYGQGTFNLTQLSQFSGFDEVTLNSLAGVSSATLVLSSGQNINVDASNSSSDQIYLSSGNSTVTLGGGANTIYFSSGAATVDANGGSNDTFFMSSGDDTISTTDENLNVYNYSYDYLGNKYPGATGNLNVTQNFTFETPYWFDSGGVAYNYFVLPFANSTISQTFTFDEANGINENYVSDTFNLSTGLWDINLTLNGVQGVTQYDASSVNFTATDPSDFQQGDVLAINNNAAAPIYVNLTLNGSTSGNAYNLSSITGVLNSPIESINLTNATLNVDAVLNSPIASIYLANNAILNVETSLPQKGGNISGDGTGILETSAASLDLSNYSVTGVTIESTNPTGTTFIVTSAAAALDVVGGPGDDTLVCQGFALTAQQRQTIFAFGSVETIKDQSGLYYKPGVAFVSINPIDGNNIINAARASSGITINGTVTDSVLANVIGQTITVDLNSQTYLGTVQNDGSWAVAIGPAALSALVDGQTYLVTASVVDTANKVATSNTKVTTDETAMLSINPIDGDGFINANNAASGITISGKASDSIPANIDGQTVTVGLNGQTYTGTVQSDGSWSVAIGPTALGALVDGHSYTVTAGVTDLANNAASTSVIVTVPIEQYAWTGPIAGSWDVAGNWEDTTANQNPASVAPGSNDSVTIGAAAGGAVQVITGTGNSASLTINGSTVLAGQFTTGSLDFNANNGGQPSFVLDTGDSLAVSGAATIGYPDVIEVNGGAFTVGGTVTELDYGNIQATNGGIVQIGGLISAEFSGGLSVDSTSQAEIGSANDAVTGELVVDSGASLSSSPTNFYNAPTIVNNGTISGGFDLSASTILNNATIAGSSAGSSSHSELSAPSIVNDGTISDVGAMVLSGSVTGTGQIDLESGAKLTISGSIASGNTIALLGTGDVLSISSSIAAPITGFGPSDIIDFAGTITSAVYNSTGTNIGTLTLYDNTTVAGTLTLAGNYSGDAFITTAIGGGVTQIVDPPATPVTINNGASLEISSSSTDAVTFAGNTGSLQLDRSQSFAGTIAGFGGQDQIDLGDIAFSSNATLAYAPNRVNTGGMLTASDGTHTANIALLGQYLASSFVTASDGHGGTLITEPSLQANNQLTQPQHA